MSTILTGPEPSESELVEQQEARRISDQDTEAARFILGCIVNSYERGEIKFERAIRDCASVAAIETVTLGHVLLGHAVKALCAIQPPAKPRHRFARPAWLNEACYGLVEKVRQEEGLPISAASADQKKTAFERVVEVLQHRGIKSVTVATVRKARQDWARTQKDAVNGGDSTGR